MINQRIVLREIRTEYLISKSTLIVCKIYDVQLKETSIDQFGNVSYLSWFMTSRPQCATSSNIRVGPSHAHA